MNKFFFKYVHHVCIFIFMDLFSKQTFILDAKTRKCPYSCGQGLSCANECTQCFYAYAVCMFYLNAIFQNAHKNKWKHG